MKVATSTAWIGGRLVRKGSLVEDSDKVCKTNPELFRDASEEIAAKAPKVFTADSPENKAQPRERAGSTASTAVAPERKKPGPKPGTRRSYPAAGSPAAPTTQAEGT
ncbi:hypothetical protein [Nonomuraea sp. NPDC050786]|uniref:hypothetical protein n=1 Tax=Nonomuraea sp. NPDC050786 TaxID=3154840 RepID=UPI0034115267